MFMNDGIPLIAYVGMIIPLAGMSIGAFAIWTEHQRKQKALEVLKVYAEQGTEPPPSLVAGIAQATSSRNARPIDSNTAAANWASAAFFLIMAVGFGGAAWWFNQGGRGAWVFTVGTGITCFVMAALSASALIRALLAPRPNVK
jgi:hypothetical protein